MREDEPGGWGLLIPFVVVKSAGGLFDDAAYCAGWEMGAVGQRLAVAQACNLLPMQVVIHRANLKQADLIAMHFELEMTEGDFADDVPDSVQGEWANVMFAIPEPAEPMAG